MRSLSVVCLSGKWCRTSLSYPVTFPCIPPNDRTLLQYGTIRLVARRDYLVRGVTRSVHVSLGGVEYRHSSRSLLYFCSISRNH